MDKEKPVTVSTINQYLESKTWEKQIPFNVTFELTYRCNEKCIHCYVDHITGDDELSFDEVASTLEELADLKTLQINFTGGEVFLREDIRDILLYARKLKFNITISTNGILIDQDMADFLRHKINPWEIGLSIYGSCAEIHDNITRVKGSFERTIDAIRYLKARNIRTKFKTVLMQQNYDDYYNIKKLAKDMGVVNLIDYNITPKLSGDAGPLDFRISDRQIQDFIINESIGLEIFKMDKEKYKKEIDLKLNGYICKGGNNFLNITPYGEVTPCVQWYFPFGNIREHGLKHVWENSEKLNMIRKTKIRDIEKCNVCEYLAYCNRCPGIAMLVDGDWKGVSTLSCKNVENIKAVIEKKYKTTLMTDKT